MHKNAVDKAIMADGAIWGGSRVRWKRGQGADLTFKEGQKRKSPETLF